MKTEQQVIIEKIAEKCLGVEYLEERKSDNLDFHNVAVWEIKNALEAAYAAGRRAASEALVDAEIREDMRYVSCDGERVTVTMCARQYDDLYKAGRS